MNYAVIIPCHDSGPQLLKTVESALRQSEPPAEVICVEDRSHEETWGLIQRLSQESGGRVRGIERDRSLGQNGREIAIRASCAEWMAMLDHDDLWLPHKMERQARLAGESKFLCSSLYEQDEDDESARRLVDRVRWLGVNDPFRVLFHRIAIVPCTVVMHRSIFDRIGHFSNDPRTKWAGDHEMWIRAARHGYSPAFDTEPLAIRRMHPGNMSRDPVPGVRAHIHMLEDIREGDPEGVRRAGGRAAARRAVHWRRLELASELLARGLREEAAEEIERVLRQARFDPMLWRLRWRNPLRRPGVPAVRQDLRRTFKEMRRWCTSLLEMPEGEGGTGQLRGIAACRE